jgi:hypothetical protein
MKRFFVIFAIMFLLISSNSVCFADNLNNFLNVVKPNFDRLLSDIKELRENIQIAEVDPNDTLTFAYRLSIRKAEIRNNRVIPFGAWSDEIEENMLVYLSIICAVKDILHIRKDKNYENEVKAFTPILTKGAFRQMIHQLTVSSETFQIGIQELQKLSPLSNINRFFVEKGIQLTEELK